MAKMATNNKFRFIDLFCGIGGFHLAMDKFGGKCVFAAEIDKDCLDVYKANYGIDASHDMTKIEAKNVPIHEVLCAGFPCQSFSKAGKQAGINDTRGTLFFEIERLLRHHHPQFIILENVRNLVGHDEGRTWGIITSVLKDIGYRLTEEPLILSPHQFGIPQLRERVYIVGKYEPKNVKKPLDIKFDNLKSKNQLSIYDILEEEDSVPVDCYISKEENRVLTAWNEFYKGINLKVIGFPVHVDYFMFEGDISHFPAWKQSHIIRNRKLYFENKEFIDKWLKKWNNLEDFTPTHRKFEWQCGDAIESVFEGLIQMRPSGIRVKLPTSFPALVAMVQIPIIGKFRRRLTSRECARLQSFPDSFKMCSNKHQALKQFGNSVNVNVLEAIFAQLIEKYGPIKLKRKPAVYNTAFVPEGTQLSLFDPQALYLNRDKHLILMGSCRKGNKDWVTRNKLYNYPITDEELVIHPELLKAEEIYVLHRRRLIGNYLVKDVKVIDKQYLIDLGYPTKGGKRGKKSKYLLYQLEEKPIRQELIDLDDYDLIVGKGVKKEEKKD